jgi:hypothetical protein
MVKRKSTDNTMVKRKSTDNTMVKRKEQTIQWSKEKVQRSIKHTHKTKDRVTRTPLKAGGELK